jgi:ATP-dependent Lhr-like helicase
VQKAVHFNIGCVDEEDGFLLYPYGDEILPEGLIYAIPPKGARKIMEAILPTTPAFSMTFRYNAGRALMMGMKSQGRQPLWLQRLKSTELLDSLRMDGKFTDVNHPLVRETKRECLEEIWDIDGVLEILNGIQSGMIAVREVYADLPSPLSLPLQWQVEMSEMYTYYPTTDGIQHAAKDDLKAIDAMKPAPEELEKQMTRSKYPEDAEQLHTLLMIEGDLLAEELREICCQEKMTQMSSEDGSVILSGAKNLSLWIDELAQRNLITYIEPGLWIAAEHLPEYAEVLEQDEVVNTTKNDAEQTENLQNIIRRMLYYRGAMTAAQISERYFLPMDLINNALTALCDADKIICDDGIYHHGKRYSRAQKATIFGLRVQAITQPGEAYAAMMASQVEKNASPAEQLELTMRTFCGQAFSVSWWESVILPRRVKGYRENMLDQFLAEGEYFWRFDGNGQLYFERYDNIDWQQEKSDCHSERSEESLSEDETLLYQELTKRGASFMRAFNDLPLKGTAQEGLLSLAEKGLVCADSFLPVRQWLNRDKMKKANPRSRVSARVMALSTGRWDIVRPLKSKKLEDWLWQLLDRHIVLCRETYSRPGAEDASWGRALEILRIWEYTGRVRRGYFVAGMSGAQFVRAEEYDGIMTAFSRHAEEVDSIQREKIIWLNAVDPGQVWVKA